MAHESFSNQDTCFLQSYFFRKKMLLKFWSWLRKKNQRTIPPCVTGHLLSDQANTNIELPVSKSNKMPISVDISMTHIQKLVEQGWYTEGDKIELNGRQYLWYILDLEQWLPSNPDDDKKGEYVWDRISVEDIAQFQNRDWTVRNLCSKTNRIWACQSKKKV